MEHSEISNHPKLSSFSGSSCSDSPEVREGITHIGHGMSECSNHLVESLRYKWMPVDIWATCVLQLIFTNTVH